MKRYIERIPAASMEAMRRYSWPGNVRELENLIERAVILSQGPTLEVPLADVERRPVDCAGDGLDRLTRMHLLRILNETNWMVGGRRGAAARLGMHRTTLQSMMKRLGIAKPPEDAFRARSGRVPLPTGSRAAAHSCSTHGANP